MPTGPDGISSCRLRFSPFQRLVVREHMEAASFHKVAEMLHGQVYHEKLAVEGAVSGLSGLENFGEIGNGMPVAIEKLLEHGTNRDIGGVCHDARWSIHLGVSQERGISKSLFDPVESGDGLISPQRSSGLVLGVGQQGKVVASTLVSRGRIPSLLT